MLQYKPVRQPSHTILALALVRHALQRVFGVGPDTRLSVTHRRVLVDENQLRCLGNDVLPAVVREPARHVFLLGDPGTLL